MVRGWCACTLCKCNKIPFSGVHENLIENRLDNISVETQRKQVKVREKCERECTGCALRIHTVRVKHVSESVEITSKLAEHCVDNRI